jgi:DNA-binding NarL/FixJ family response regulator
MLLADEAIDGVEAVKKVTNNTYDVVVLDISMPRKNGLDVLKSIKSLKPELPVLILTVHPEEKYAVRALRAGASGYLMKTVSPAELILAIRKIARGEKYMSSSIAEKLVGELIPNEEPSHSLLSDREYQVMCMFVSGKSSNEIADELSLSVQTVSTYRNRILEKLNMKTIADVIRYAIKNGIID